MSATDVLTTYDDELPKPRWPGYALVDRAGAALARDMICELESADSDDAGVTVADYSCLENWPRQGRPFRNVVAEYLAMARAAGPSVVEGFCAVLSDYVSISCSGSCPCAGNYDDVAGEQDADN